MSPAPSHGVSGVNTHDYQPCSTDSFKMSRNKFIIPGLPQKYWQDSPSKRPTTVGLYYFKRKTEMSYPVHILKTHLRSFYKYLFFRNLFSFTSKSFPLMLNESILCRHSLVKSREGIIIALMKMALTIQGHESKLKPHPITDPFIRAIMRFGISMELSTGGKCILILNDNNSNHFVP